MRTLERKIPPAALVLLFTVLMWLVSTSEALTVAIPRRTTIATIFWGAGFAIIFGGLLEFRRAKTTVNPITPEATTALVTSGLYRFTRNPMYLQLVLVCIGFAIILTNIWILLLTPVCAWVLYRFAILPEEAYLERKFGEKYLSYKRRVRRWL